LIGAGWSPNDFADNSERDEADLLENVVFVMIGPVELKCYLPRSRSEVHSLQLSDGVVSILIDVKAVLKFKVPDSLQLVGRNRICWHEIKLDSRRDHSLVAEKLNSPQLDRKVESDDKLLRELTKFARKPSTAVASAKLVVSIYRLRAIGGVGRADLVHFEVQRHRAYAMVLLLQTLLPDAILREIID
jgi:hypothetical protein